MLSWPALLAWLWSHKHLAADAALGVVVALLVVLRRAPHDWLFGFTIPELLLAGSLAAHHFMPAVSAVWAFFFPAVEDD